MNSRLEPTVTQAISHETGRHSLKVAGFTPLTANDFPGCMASVVYVQGCPWTCGYCHSPHLQQRLQKSPLHWQRMLRFLSGQRGSVGAVVFSGGEPTIDAGLHSAVLDVRKLGFKVGLHSGGAYPRRLSQLLPDLDWVALDVKANFDNYEKVTGDAESGTRVRECVETVLDSGIDYELRTTMHPSLHSEAEAIALAKSLAAMGAKNYTLQAFRPQGCKSRTLNAAGGEATLTVDTLAYVATLFPNFQFKPA